MQLIATFQIGGYSASNRPVSFLLFNTMGTGVIVQAMNFVIDMKLGHYTKIPPRQMFLAQVVATVLSSFIVVGVVQFQLGVEGMCNPAVNIHWVWYVPPSPTSLARSRGQSHDAVLPTGKQFVMGREDTSMDIISRLTGVLVCKISTDSQQWLGADRLRQLDNVGSDRTGKAFHGQGKIPHPLSQE